jgi:hypothetical protein
LVNGSALRQRALRVSGGTTFLISGIAATNPALVGETYIDGNGNRYLPMCRQPIVIYAADRTGSWTSSAPIPSYGRGPQSGEPSQFRERVTGLMSVPSALHDAAERRLLERRLAELGAA